MDKTMKDRLELCILGAITILLIVLLVFSAVKLKIDENNSSSETENSVLDNQESFNETKNDMQDNSKPEENTTTEDKSNTNQTSTTIDNSSSSKEEAKEPENTSTPITTPSATTPTENTNDKNISNSNSSSNTNLDNSTLSQEEQEPEVINEDAVVTYLRTLESESFSSNDTSFKEQAKNLFVTIVDFLFYDSEIKGYTFSELTTSAKLKVVQIALSVDDKIDEYFPDYKENIKEKMSDLKAKAALLYLEQTSKICSSENMENTCKVAREDFKNMKESFGFTWDIIKTGVSSSYQELKTLLDEWYQSIR